jgi:FAD/FMN-containing dehydrogenase
MEQASSEVKDAFNTRGEVEGAITLLMQRVKSALDPMNLLRPGCSVGGI